MPVPFILRMQFGPHQDAAQVQAWLLDLVQSAPVDEINWFLYAEELNDGHETLPSIARWLEFSRPIRKALAAQGVGASLNPWHSVLHCDRGRRFKPEQTWTPMEDQHGHQAKAQVCPLDPQWRAYYAQALALFAAEGFRVVWIDDDIRLHNHPPLEWGGCFCPLHVAAFNRHAGTQATREEIVAACLRPGTPHPWREAWLDTWEQGQLELIRQWRGILETGGARLGLMSSGMEAHAAEGRRWQDWWRAQAGEGVPVHRPHFWDYSEAPGSVLPNSMAVLDQARSLHPSQAEVAPEIECFPYGRWNKSFRQTGAQMALAVIQGASHLNISLYDFMGNAPADEPQRADFLRRWKPVCNWLGEQFPPAMRPLGIGLPWSQDLSRKARVAAGEAWSKLEVSARGWARWLGGAGLAFNMRPSSTVNAIAGPIAWSFSDEQLKTWLAQGLLLDGPAAAVLIERGYGPLIGLKDPRWIAQLDTLYSMEQCLDPALSLRAGAQISLNDKPYSARLLQGSLLPGAKVASDLRSPLQKVLGHGLVTFENSLGGRVAIVPWSALDHDCQMNGPRAAQLERTTSWLAKDRPVGWVEGAWLIPQFYTDGKTWRAVVWNANPDECQRFRLRLPEGLSPAVSAVQVDAQGELRSAKLEGEAVVLAAPMHQWEFVVLSGGA